MKAFLNDVRFFWFVLAIPAIPMTMGLLSGASFDDLLHPTGEFAARFTIFAMLLSPLKLLLNNPGWVRWLMRRRRAIGVAAFLYALAHTLLYVLDMGSVTAMLEELGILGIWTGWVAMAIFIPLAITSNNLMVRKLQSNWKKLQRFVYAAALFTLIHWMFVHNNIGPALVHFVPLALAESYRVYHWFGNRKLETTSAV